MNVSILSLGVSTCRDAEKGGNLSPSSLGDHDLLIGRDVEPSQYMAAVARENTRNNN